MLINVISPDFLIRKKHLFPYFILLIINCNCNSNCIQFDFYIKIQ